MSELHRQEVPLMAGCKPINILMPVNFSVRKKTAHQRVVVQDFDPSFSPLCFLYEANERGKITPTPGYEVCAIHHHSTKNGIETVFHTEWISYSDIFGFYQFGNSPQDRRLHPTGLSGLKME